MVIYQADITIQRCPAQYGCEARSASSASSFTWSRRWPALCAARIAEITIGEAALPLPAPGGGISDGKAFLIEVLFSYALAATVLNTATTASIGDNSFYGLAIGFVVLAGGYSAGGVSGAAFNPAVASGLFAVAGENTNLWIYWVAPMVGGLAAGLFFHIINAEENDLRLGKTDEIEHRGAAIGAHTTNYKAGGKQQNAWLAAMTDANLMFDLGKRGDTDTQADGEKVVPSV